MFSQKRSTTDIWQDSKYGSAAWFLYFSTFFGSILEWPYERLVFLLKNGQLLCSRDVNWKYHEICYWFPDHLLDIGHGNIKFSYIYTIEMWKSSIWKTSRWNARLIDTIDKNNNRNSNGQSNKSKDGITKIFKEFLPSKTLLPNNKNIYFLSTYKIFQIFQIFLPRLSWSWRLLGNFFHCFQICKNLHGNLNY